MPTPGHLPTRHSPAIGTGHHGASGVPGDTGDVQTLGLGWGVAQSMQAGDLQHTMYKLSPVPQHTPKCQGSPWPPTSSPGQPELSSWAGSKDQRRDITDTGSDDPVHSPFCMTPPAWPTGALKPRVALVVFSPAPWVPVLLCQPMGRPRNKKQLAEDCREKQWGGAWPCGFDP